jgi:hypothetical protein
VFLCVPSAFANSQKQASDATQKALWKQFQVDDKINKTLEYVTQPLPFRSEVAAIGYGFNVYRRKQIQFKLSSRERLTIGPNFANISITF